MCCTAIAIVCTQYRMYVQLRRMYSMHRMYNMFRMNNMYVDMYDLIPSTLYLEWVMIGHRVEHRSGQVASSGQMSVIFRNVSFRIYLVFSNIRRRKLPTKIHVSAEHGHVWNM